MHSGKINSRYSQLDTVLVQKGQTVIAGELIGKVGRSGLSYGVHLHFEILVNDIAQDPRKYVDFKDIEKFASKSR
jgi:lysostaphin